MLKYLSILLSSSLSLASCGYTSRHNEISGQVKKVIRETPLICPNRDLVDVSLGFMKNGQGSVSHEDTILFVPDQLVEIAKKFNESGQPVKVTYSTLRFAICVPERQLESIEGI